MTNTYRATPALDASALQDFVDMLVGVRETMNAVLLYTGATKVPDPATWAAAIMEFGCRHLRTCWHLRPVSLPPRYRDRVPAVLRSPTAGSTHTSGWSDVGEIAAGAVGLFGDPMSRVVRRWMVRHDVFDPAEPWQLACRLADESVAQEQDAMWRLRTGFGKVYNALPWREAARMAEADGALAQVSLAEEATLAACAARLKREGAT